MKAQDRASSSPGSRGPSSSRSWTAGRRRRSTDRRLDVGHRLRVLRATLGHVAHEVRREEGLSRNVQCRVIRLIRVGQPVDLRCCLVVEGLARFRGDRSAPSMKIGNQVLLDRSGHHLLLLLDAREPIEPVVDPVGAAGDVAEEFVAADAGPARGGQENLWPTTLAGQLKSGWGPGRQGWPRIECGPRGRGRMVAHPRLRLQARKRRINRYKALSCVDHRFD